MRSKRGDGLLLTGLPCLFLSQVLACVLPPRPGTPIIGYWPLRVDIKLACQSVMGIDQFTI